MGTAVLLGLGYILAFHRHDVMWQDPRMSVGFVGGAVVGLAGVGKGALGLLLGQVFESDA